MVKWKCVYSVVGGSEWRRLFNVDYPSLLPPILLVGKTSIVNRSRRYHQLPIWWRSVLGVAKRSEYSACPKQINKCHRCLPRLLAPGELSVIRNGIEPEVFNREVKRALQQQAKNNFRNETLNKFGLPSKTLD